MFDIYLLSLIKVKNFSKNSLITGFSLAEILIMITLIAVLGAISVPSFLGFIDTMRLNSSQDKVYLAIRQAQSQAVKEKLTWQVSFREQNSIVQWAVHQATVKPSAAQWYNLDTNVRLDQETTFTMLSGVRQMQFDFHGSVRQPPLGRITLSSKYAKKVKRCVYVSTILGALRTAKQRTKADRNGDFCY